MASFSEEEIEAEDILRKIMVRIYEDPAFLQTLRDFYTTYVVMTG